MYVSFIIWSKTSLLNKHTTEKLLSLITDDIFFFYYHFIDIIYNFRIQGCCILFFLCFLDWRARSFWHQGYNFPWKFRTSRGSSLHNSSISNYYTNTNSCCIRGQHFPQYIPNQSNVPIYFTNGIGLVWGLNNKLPVIKK